MDRRLRLALPLAAALCAFFAAEDDAQALGPVDLEVGAKVGVGTNPDSKGPNPYGFGIGARGGVQLFKLYAGVNVVHYFGGSLELPIAAPTTGAPSSVKIDYSSTLFGGELGYTISVIPLIDIRPQMGVGSATFAATSSGITSSTGKLYLEPGLTVIVPLGLLFVGADANALIVPSIDAPEGGSKTYTSFTLHGQIGIRL
jgi:hypothetical protein